MMAYHISGTAPFIKRRLSPHHMLVEKSGHKHLWSTGLCSDSYDSTCSSAEQTKRGFDDASSALAQHGACLRDHGIRTWIYLKDVDVHYAGMVESRRALFQQQGMNGDTHYISSTAIEGAPAHKNGLVAMDIYSILDLEERQISFLYDSDFLPSRNHQVAFEYGTKVQYRDRSHLFPSGTGSVDNALKILHVGDTMRQLERSFANIEALLRAGGSDLRDLSHLIVYLRDLTDYKRVKDYLDKRFSSTPRLVVLAPVCNPDWLVEVECMAIRAQASPEFPPF